jgi:hypothetical protein
MRFEKRYDGITYAIAIKPRSDDKRLLGRLEIEIYRKYSSGERRGCDWKISFFDRELKVERCEYSGLSWHKVEISARADWLGLEEWYFEDVEKTIRDLGVKDAAKHFLEHLRLIFDHPLVIPLRL